MWIVDLGMWIRGCGLGGEYITCGLCCQHLTGYVDCGILLLKNKYQNGTCFKKYTFQLPLVF